MNDQALLQAVLDEPDEDAPRLVYADWLEETGRVERAELIRVQIERERLAAYDPGYARLAARSSALLRRYSLEWRPVLPAWASCQVWDDWRRGFLEQVVLAARHYARKGEELCRLAPLRSVRLDPVIRSFQLLADSPNLGLLPHVTFADTLRDHHVEALATSPHLARVRTLHFDYNWVSDGTLVALAGSPHASALETLVINGIACYSRQLTATGVEALGRSTSLPALRSLRLEHYALRGDAAEALMGSSLIGRLNALDLTENRLSIAAVRVLARAPVKGLRSLRLNSCTLGDAGVAALAASPNLAGLRSLNLANNRIGPKGVRALAQSPHLAGLRSLALGQNALGDEGLELLAGSPHLSSLTALDLSEQDPRGAFTLRGLEVLLSSPLAARLVRLDLTRTPLGDEGARLLAGSASLSRLEWLGVGEAGLTPRGLRVLLRSPHLAGLAAMNWAQKQDLPPRSPLTKQLRERMGHEDDHD